MLWKCSACGFMHEGNEAHDEAWVMKQRSKAELAGHVARGKW